jgi:uncharacterized protein (DUF2126 family)
MVMLDQRTLLGEACRRYVNRFWAEPMDTKLIYLHAVLHARYTDYHILVGAPRRRMLSVSTLE